MKTALHWFSTVFAIVVLGITGYSIVEAYNRDYRRQQAVAEQRTHDVRLCRTLLGIDNDFGQRKLMMACAAEVQAGRPAHGEMRSVLAERAWRQCMPIVPECERALTP